jgi:hypothetical protein
MVTSSGVARSASEQLIAWTTIDLLLHNTTTCSLLWYRTPLCRPHDAGGQGAVNIVQDVHTSLAHAGEPAFCDKQSQLALQLFFNEASRSG